MKKTKIIVTMLLAVIGSIPIANALASDDSECITPPNDRQVYFYASSIADLDRLATYGIFTMADVKTLQAARPGTTTTVTTTTTRHVTTTHHTTRGRLGVDIDWNSAFAGECGYNGTVTPNIY